MTERSVLNVIQIPGWGGVHTVTERITYACAELGWRTVCAIPAREGAAAERLTEAGAQVVEFDISRIRRPASPRSLGHSVLQIRSGVRSIAGMIDQVKPDVVQVNGVHHFHGALAAKAAAAPLAWAIHSDQPPRLARSIGGPTIARLADVVMTSGVAVSRRFRGLEMAGSADLFSFCAPVEGSRFARSDRLRREARRNWGVDPEDVVIGTIGGRGPNKNHGQLVDAFARLHLLNPRVRLVIAGPELDQHRAWYRQEVWGRIERLPAETRSAITVTDAGGQVPTFLNGYDVFALTSRGEGASLATGEALSVGLPVVANDIGSLADTVIPGVTGYLNRSRTDEELAGHLARLASDPSLRAQLARGASAHGRRLTVDRCAGEHVAAYERAVSSP